jgi:hypothetical protein
MDHSVLGARWVYDASADPVYARTLASTILRGGEQAELIYVGGDEPIKREATTFVRGSGSSTDDVPDVRGVTFVHSGHVTTIETGELTLRVLRVIDPEINDDPLHEATLRGRWPGHDQWTLLSTASRTSLS